MAEWRNWSGSVIALSERLARPRSEADLAAIAAAAKRVRVAGTGHCFMPVCETDGVLISLADMGDDLAISPGRQPVWAPAGLSIGALTAALWAQGLSLANRGDIEPRGQVPQRAPARPLRLFSTG